MPVDTQDPPLAPKAKEGAAKMAGRFNQAMEGDPDPAKAAGQTPPEPVKGIPDPAAAKLEEPVKLEKGKKDASENFKALNQKFDEFRATSESRIKELTEQLNKKEEWFKTELETTTKKLTEYQQLVNRYYLENDPDFKASFGGRIDAAIMDAKEAAGSTHAQAVEDILKMPPGDARAKALGAFIREKRSAEEFDEFEVTGLRTAFDKLKTVERERASELDKSAQNNKALDLHRTVQASQLNNQKRAIRETLFSDKLASFSQSIPEFREKDGDTEHNAIVAETRQNAKNWLESDLTDEGLVKLSLWAAKGHSSVKTDAIRDALIAKLQAQVTKLTSAHPEIHGQGSDRPKGQKPTVKTATSRWHEAMEKGIPEQQAA